MDTVIADPVDHPEKFWLKQSILNYALLFVDECKLDSPETEQDLLDNVYGFIKKSSRLSGTTAYGAKQSQAASENKNSATSIGSSSKVVRKYAAENADLTFRYLSHELFCLEVGLYDHGPNDTKEMNESSIKSPIMMKNFCTRLISQYRIKPTNIRMMGAIISGLSITGMGMSFNNGSVALLSSSNRLHMPESVAEIPRLLPPILNLIYNINRMLKCTVEELKNINSSVCIENDMDLYFPPCFVPAAAATIIKKRRI
ncbi:hypothetical protein BDB01DRAFT_790637 [Pilobolus umbonatus]|nr:hypothetical protein BDB01DRAFT_790637 [Pilobolus umbonatus]